MAGNKKPKAPPDDPEESRRFVETAKQIEASNGKMFARAFKKIVHPNSGGRRKTKPV
jgi:hypothetical protein